MPRNAQVQRVFKILKILHEGGTICMKEEEIRNLLVLIESDVQPRSIQIDMQLVKEYLGENLSYHNHCYKLIKKDALEDFFKENSKEIKEFFHLISLIDKSAFGENFKKYAALLEQLSVDQKEVYSFLENPFENLNKFQLKKQLEEYIQNRKYLHIEYYSDKLYKFQRVQAYKIIYSEGNWYLGVFTTEDLDVNEGVRFLRLNFIKTIKVHSSPPMTFHEDGKVKDFFNNKLQSLFSTFGNEEFIVKLQISKNIKRHFKVKNFLKSQRIIGKVGEDLLVEFTVTNPMEILPLIQKWLPNIIVLEPLYLKERILKNINIY